MARARVTGCHAKVAQLVELLPSKQVVASSNLVFCSMRKRERKEKQCLNCNKEIPNRNKYCNNTCQGEYERKIIFESIENGNTSLYIDNYRKYLISKYGEKCMECSWDQRNPITKNVPIQLEHIDGNSDNNSLDNLKLLCPNCHSLTPTFGALNKGNGRELRRLKRQEKKEV